MRHPLALLPDCFGGTSKLPLKPSELDLEACILQCNGSSQDMEVLASTLTVAGTGIQASKTAKEYYQNYRDAKEHIAHAKSHDQQLDSNLEHLKQLSPSNQERVAPAQALLNDIKATVPPLPDITRKRDRWKWIASQRAAFERAIVQTNRVETSATLSLLISLFREM